MHDTVANLVQGDVLACGAAFFVVYGVAQDGAQLIRVQPNHNRQHRADVVPDWVELDGSGLPQADIVIRCVPFLKADAFGFTRVGRISRKLQLRITAAYRRELDARRIEDSPPVRSTLLSMEFGGSRGRKVGRQNAT